MKYKALLLLALLLLGPASYAIDNDAIERDKRSATVKKVNPDNLPQVDKLEDLQDSYEVVKKESKQGCMPVRTTRFLDTIFVTKDNQHYMVDIQQIKGKCSMSADTVEFAENVPFYDKITIQNNLNVNTSTAINFSIVATLKQIDKYNFKNLYYIKLNHNYLVYYYFIYDKKKQKIVYYKDDAILIGSDLQDFVYNSPKVKLNISYPTSEYTNLELIVGMKMKYDDYTKHVTSFKQLLKREHEMLSKIKLAESKKKSKL